MAEFVVTRAGVISCFADPPALDRLASAFRVAPDEAMLMCAPNDRETLARDTRQLVHDVDPDSLVIDTTDGWSLLTLNSPESHEVFARLSSLSLEAGFAAGDVAGVAARVFAKSDRIHLVFPAMLDAYMRDSLIAAGASESEAAPRDWSDE